MTSNIYFLISGLIQDEKQSLDLKTFKMHKAKADEVLAFRLAQLDQAQKELDELQMDGDKLVEYVEKREYDAVVLALRDAHNRLEQQLQDAVKRLSEVTDEAIESAYWSSWTSTQIVRNLFISAAKGEQP